MYIAMNKKSFLAALLLMAAGLQTAWAQLVTFDKKTGDADTYNLLQVDSITFSELNSVGGHQYVDLNLPSGTLWATTNVGANAPEEFGDYFACGKTQPNEFYNEGETYPNSVLLPEDDAATANWGSDWQTPTTSQFGELFDEECTIVEWTILNGVKGCLIKSKTGPGSIFLPAAGHYEEISSDFIYQNSYGFYWFSDYTNHSVGFYNSKRVVKFGIWSNGTNDLSSVRPVLLKEGEKEVHEYVDLGLPSGTLWATTNVGAHTPEEYGDYFAWGETMPKDDYSLGTYRYCDGDGETMTKYNDTDGSIELMSMDDAATANWGRDWQMPSLAQMQELCDNTTSISTLQNGVYGWLFTASNGNSLFLPAAGFRRGTSGETGSGYYWSRSLDTNYDSYAHDLILSGSINCRGNGRQFGHSVRPVRK